MIGVAGLHHVTSLAADARRTDAFFTGVLGLRRVKKTVNFDHPEVYHLYYGDRLGSAGTVITYFPFPGIGPRAAGGGEVAAVLFSVPPGALRFWRERLASFRVVGEREETADGLRLDFTGPDGENLALVEQDDARSPWLGGGVPEAAAIRGFHGVTVRVAEPAASGELLELMGYESLQGDAGIARYARPGGNAADLVEIHAAPQAEPAQSGAGSVHHIAFSVPDTAALRQARGVLIEAGYAVTPVIGRDYFLSIYFRSPGGVLFEIATDTPGFTRDEPVEHLGEALKLPAQHAHRREQLERNLQPLG
jgi:glyoxalase family protein